MTGYKSGDVLLVEFDFTDGSGSKKRPATIVSADNYHRERREMIVAAITSNTRRILFGDTKIVQWKEAGLLFPSVVTGIVRTIHSSMVVRHLGTIAPSDLANVRRNLHNILMS